MMKLMSQSWVNRNLILFTLVFWTSSAFSQSLFNIYAKRDIKKFEQHIKKKPDLANSQENGNFIIHLVTRNNSLPFLKILVDNGSNINQQDIQGYTPLYYAVINGNREILNIPAQTAPPIPDKTAPLFRSKQRHSESVLFDADF